MSEPHELNVDDSGDGEPNITPDEVAQALRLTGALRPAIEVSRFAQNLQRQLNQISVPDTSWIPRSTILAMSRAAEYVQAVKSAVAPLQQLQSAVTAQWGGFFTALEQFRKAAWPENWAGVSELDAHVVKSVCRDEGIPLMWVPRAGTVQALLAAPDAPARRRIIGQRHRGILADCRTVIDSVTHPSLRPLRDYAAEAVNALTSGHAAAAQSLAANLLDTLITEHVDHNLHDLLKRRKAHRETRLDFDDFQFRAGLALAPVWSAYVHFYPNQGDAVPRQFARNATAHTVSRKQFSRVNAVIAVMVVSSLLRLIDDSDAAP